MNVIERFLEYVKIDTCSDEESGTSPSSFKQHDLASLLYNQLQAMGAREVHYDRTHCYIYGSIPASEGYEDVPAVGFIAHKDTSPAMSGTDVKPRIIENYDGQDIVLNEALNVVLKVADFPEISKYEGKDLIVTDGTTLLGADDKAGVAEIMAMAEYFLNHPEIKHGRIEIGFTPDEEVGCGTDYFNLDLFNCQYAYTVDGGGLGELEYENFNAANAKVHFYGRGVHPGSAKGKMKNAILIAQEFQSLLPVFENPMYTEGYEGFFHLDSINGNVEEVRSDYIIRDHDMEKFEEKKRIFMEAANFLNKKYGEGTVDADLRDSYYNMSTIIKNNMHLIDKVENSMKELDITPLVTPIRGGTDGARLSFMGLPCPNICTGGENFHGKYEYVCVQSMEKIVELLIRLAQKFVE